jgi:hypothetical protein
MPLCLGQEQRIQHKALPGPAVIQVHPPPEVRRRLSGTL